ncbi:MAG: metallophosphoesterase [Propionibacteriaceae bacterium]|jgi:3',5'-cyclic AMP phosphodiesterase CpdA|nr:metallophosphoesterase [Propionibacteriaceae bacterium]
MKILFAGDYHLKPQMLEPLKRLADTHQPDRIVFLGDLVDDWDAAALDYDRGLEQLADFVNKQGRATVTLLYGNHDLRYLEWPPVMDGFGYNASAALLIKESLEANADIMRVAEDAMDAAGSPWLFTHAGLTKDWAKRYLANDMSSPNPDVTVIADSLNAMVTTAQGRAELQTVGYLRGGRGIPGPLWADFDELTSNLFPGINQVIGHTPQTTCQHLTTDNGDQVWACDTWSTYMNNRPIGDRSFLLMDFASTEATVLR